MQIGHLDTVARAVIVAAHRMRVERQVDKRLLWIP
jgi:hypothetical protein